MPEATYSFDYTEYTVAADGLTIHAVAKTWTGALAAHVIGLKIERKGTSG